MIEVRNKNGKKVCELDPDTKQVFIKLKECTTVIKLTRDNKIQIINK
ncbi:hypothetical protein [Facklamia hominis]